MRRSISVLLCASLLLLASGCSYHRAHLNLEDFAEEMPLQPAAFQGERLGKVAANEGGAIWNDCTRSASGSLWVIMDEARRMGGNAVGEIRWLPNREKRNVQVPTCKKSWAWFLVWPVLVTPVFMSSRVEGYAFKVPESALSTAGVYRIPDSQDEREEVVARILADSRANAARPDSERAGPFE